MINYRLISEAILQYEKLGYQYLEVPWIVPSDAIKITLPVDRKAFSIDNHGYLVGSAEQSFLDLILRNKLKDGKYVAATPCFRDDKIDEYHQKYFFKVELINYSSNNFIFIKDLENLLSDAVKILQTFTTKTIKLSLMPDGSYDLHINGIEVGSYGIRHHNNFGWVYGTGLAEPRFSQVK